MRGTFEIYLAINVYRRNGSRVPLGVVPRLPFRSVDTVGGSTDGFRGVRIPDGVDVPLKFRLNLPKKI